MVKVKITNKIYDIEIKENTSTLDLKNIIFEKYKIKVNKQKLYFSGNLLNDEYILYNYNIDNNSFIIGSIIKNKKKIKVEEIDFSSNLEDEIDKILLANGFSKKYIKLFSDKENIAKLMQNINIINIQHNFNNNEIIDYKSNNICDNLFNFNPNINYNLSFNSNLSSSNLSSSNLSSSNLSSSNISSFSNESYVSDEDIPELVEVSDIKVNNIEEVKISTNYTFNTIYNSMQSIITPYSSPNISNLQYNYNSIKIRKKLLNPIILPIIYRIFYNDDSNILNNYKIIFDKINDNKNLINIIEHLTYIINSNKYIEMTQTDYDNIKTLESIGFNEKDAFLAYITCNKNLEEAANLLYIS
jgi:hypothetical protein